MDSTNRKTEDPSSVSLLFFLSARRWLVILNRVLPAWFPCSFNLSLLASTFTRTDTPH
jgi:hypothetical protein